MLDRHAVDLLFWDQYDFLAGLREHASQWRLFSWQHGPHRMGLGYLFIEAVYGLSGWNTRVEGFAMGAIFLVILALVLLLKVRAVGPLTFFDAIIPALVLTRTDFETFFGVPNAAHGPIPLLLVALAPFCWLIERRALRIGAVALLSFCAAYTGFAIFLVPCLCAVLLFDRGDRPWALLCAAPLGLFAIGYQFVPAVACYRFPAEHPLEYAPFAGLAVLRPVALGHLVPGARLLGWAAALFALAVVALACRGLLRERTLRTRATFLFAAFSGLFVANAAVGRVCLGLDQALASRYVPYLLPLWLAAYFLACDWLPRWPKVAAVAVAAVFVVQVTVRNDGASMRWFSEGKTRWRECFLRTGDEPLCNRTSNFRDYPADGAPQVRAMFDYLRANRLNLYSGGVRTN